MTSDSKIVLSMGRDRDDLEMTVVAEYEDGVSLKSGDRSERQRRPPAARRRPARGGPSQTQAALSPTAESGPARAGAGKIAVPLSRTTRQPRGRRRPGTRSRQVPPARPLITPPGHFRSSLGASYARDSFHTQGEILVESTQTFNLGGGVTITETTLQLEEGTRTDIRTTLDIPVDLHVGLLPGLELWGEANFGGGAGGVPDLPGPRIPAASAATTPWMPTAISVSRTAPRVRAWAIR